MPRAFLGVECSATGRRWVGLSDAQDRHAQNIAQQAELPEIIARTLARRDVAPEDAKAFLAPSLRDLMPNPSVLKDMDKAAERICQAVDKKQRIAVFADYDVDGATSAALLITWLRDFGMTATLYVPDRIDEGYGPNDEAMQRLAASHDLIICVDCGTLSQDRKSVV